MSDAIDISVVYTLPNDSFWQRMTVPRGVTAMEAVEKSGVLEKFPDIDMSKIQLAIYSRPIKPSQVLEQDDRVELLRPLIAAPKTVPKKKKAKAGKAK
jgi:putative ubiquitin-RnfH superfamily antitoxin RatB of RatAB toxin-antitoxin module